MTAAATASPAHRPPGRPRDPEVDRAILAAAVDLLVEGGFEALTVDAVAGRAGVARASVYRRHANRAALLVAACEAFSPPPLDAPDTGAIRSDLVAIGRALVHSLCTSDAGRLLPTMLAASSSHPEAREALATFFSTRRSPTMEAVRRAVDRGELPADTDPDLVIDLLTGAVINRVVLRGGRVSGARVEQLVDVIVGGLTGRR